MGIRGRAWASFRCSATTAWRRGAPSIYATRSCLIFQVIVEFEYVLKYVHEFQICTIVVNCLLFFSLNGLHNVQFLISNINQNCDFDPMFFFQKKIPDQQIPIDTSIWG